MTRWAGHKAEVQLTLNSGGLIIHIIPWLAGSKTISEAHRRYRGWITGGVIISEGRGMIVRVFRGVGVGVERWGQGHPLTWPYPQGGWFYLWIITLVSNMSYLSPLKVTAWFRLVHWKDLYRQHNTSKSVKTSYVYIYIYVWFDFHCHFVTRKLTYAPVIYNLVYEGINTHKNRIYN